MAGETVVTPHQDTASQAAQTAEAAARAQGKSGPLPGGEFEGTVGPGDGSPQDPGAPAPVQRADPAADPQPRDLTPRSPFDNKRAAITARFREERAVAPEETDHIDDFTRSGGLPKDFMEASGQENRAENRAENPEENPAEDTASIPEETRPQTFKVKVNGQEREITLEEMTKHAQIALASDQILDTAKAKLKEINELEANIRAQRGAPSGHQAAPAQPAEPAQPEPAPPNQDEQIAALIEAIQFGDDPAKARELLRNTIASIAQPVPVQEEVQKALVQERMRDDGARTAKVLDGFKKDNPEFATDPLAQAVLERKMYDLQAEDLQQLGLDPANLVQGRPTTPADIASAHKWYRANGMAVRPPDVLLNEAAKAVSEWRGVTAPPNPADPQRGAPRVIVNRDARREAIQQQPSRSVPAPRPPVQQQAQPADRSSIVERMKAQRAAKRGQVLGV